jgi:hypothetical protein
MHTLQRVMQCANHLPCHLAVFIHCFEQLIILLLRPLSRPVSTRFSVALSLAFEATSSLILFFPAADIAVLVTAPLFRVVEHGHLSPLPLAT